MIDVPHDVIELQDGKCRVVEHPLLGSACLQIGDDYIELGDIRRVNLAKAVFESGRRGPVPIPKDPEHCAQILERYERHLDRLYEEVWNRVVLKTSNERLQAKIVSIVIHRVMYAANHPEEATKGGASGQEIGLRPGRNKSKNRRCTASAADAKA